MAEHPRATRQCDTCAAVLPLTSKSFQRIHGCSQSFHTSCRKCRAQQQRKKKLENLETKALDTFISKVVRGGPNVPHTAELLESLMNYFGGTNGFASMVLKQYYDAPPGSRNRSSLLELVVKLASKNTEQGGAKKPIDLYSEEELEEEINKRLEQAVLIHSGMRCIDVSPSPEAAAVNPLANLPDALQLPEGRAEDLAKRADREAHGGLAALQANREADGVSQLPLQ